ncbi:hypothetical protein FOZ63_018735 [Perkinsus olseni]|uniref:TatD DNase n=1 Tax=Perkinsus olseni TaxID=32597 RepID=A0A7J6TLS5_PEROL|nr:hypothetical protein FOZ63_018735 [Perkinsus olseni]
MGSGEGHRPQLFFTAGVHPHEVKNCDENTISELRQLAASPYCVAIGECGLDYDRMFSAREDQLAWFDKQVALASDLHMPLFLHERDRGRGGGTLGSDQDCLRILSKHRIDPKLAVFHCFTGSRQVAQEYIQKGYWIGLTGYLCMRERGASIRSLVSCGYLPLSRLVLETDCPYMKGDDDYYDVDCLSGTKKTEPAGTVAVAKALAELMNVSVEEVAERTTENVLKLFPKISEVDGDEHPSDDEGFWYRPPNPKVTRHPHIQSAWRALPEREAVVDGFAKYFPKNYQLQQFVATVRDGRFCGTDYPYNLLPENFWKRRRYNVEHDKIPYDMSTVSEVMYYPRMNCWRVGWTEKGRPRHRLFRVQGGTFLDAKSKAEKFRKLLESCGRVDNRRTVRHTRMEYLTTKRERKMRARAFHMHSKGLF